MNYPPSFSMMYTCKTCQSSFTDRAKFIAHGIPVRVLRCDDVHCSHVARSECEFEQHSVVHSLESTRATSKFNLQENIDRSVTLANENNTAETDRKSPDYNLQSLRLALNEIDINVPVKPLLPSRQSIESPPQTPGLDRKRAENHLDDQHSRSSGPKKNNLGALDPIPFRYAYRSRRSSSDSDNSPETALTPIPITKNYGQRDSVVNVQKAALGTLTPDPDLYICKTCEVRFDTPVALQTHQKDEEHCFCGICITFFGNEAERRKHQNATHAFRCQACEAVYPSLTGLSNHQIQAGHCFCNICKKFFAPTEELESHKLASHVFICAETNCNREFDHEDILRTHQKQYNHLYCPHCDQSFNSPDSLQKHDKECHGFRCDICSYRFPNLIDLQDHQRSANHCFCKICNITFLYAESAKTHAQIKHSFRCPVSSCQASFDKAGLLTEHQEDDNHSYCIACRQCFPSEFALSLHQRSKHNHNCPECRLCYPSKEALITHQEEKLHCYCASCALHFGSDDLSKQHFSQVHTIPCPDNCGQRFPDVTLRRTHQVQARHCCCTKCNIPFDNPQALETHKQSKHPGGLPYCCRANACYRGFCAEFDLQQHKRDTHHLYCSGCDRYFTSQVGYDKHAERDCRKRHDCRPCQISYSKEEKARLKAHVRQVHDEKLSTYCSQCGINFHSKLRLDLHFMHFRHFT